MGRLIKKHKNNSIKKMPAYKQIMPLSIGCFMILFPFIVIALAVSAEVGKSIGIIGESIEVMLYCKEILLISFTFFVVCWLIGENIFPDNIVKDVPIRTKNKILYILAGIIIVAVIISSILSEHTELVWMGGPGEAEGALALICYVILFFVAYNNFYYDRAIKVFEIALIIMTAVLVVFSMVEFLYKPYIMWGPVKEVMKLFITDEQAVALHFIDDKNRVVLSMSNSNYYGGFCAVLFPLIYEMWVGAIKKRRQTMMSFLVVGLMFCVILSKSSFALYMMIIEIVVLTAFQWKMIMEKILGLAMIVVTFVISLILLDMASEGTFVELAKVGVTNNDAYDVQAQEKYVIDDIEMSDDRVTIMGESNGFSIINTDEGLMFCDEKDEILEVEVDKEGWLSIEEEEYEDIRAYVSAMTDGTGRISVKLEMGYKDTIDFYITKGCFKGVGANGTEISDIESDMEVVQKYDSAFTGRGYAWKRTLPLLKSTIIIGKGPGNFPYYFDQYDYEGLLKTHGSHKVIIDKPHNMFLQYSVNIGVLGTLAVYGMIVYVLITGAKILWKMRKSEGEYCRYLYIGSYMAVIGFLIYGVLNDGVVAITPYLWIYLGVNRSLQYKMNNNCE